jgi:hypothetical protein
MYLLARHKVICAHEPESFYHQAERQDKTVGARKEQRGFIYFRSTVVEVLAGSRIFVGSDIFCIAYTKSIHAPFITCNEVIS